MNKRTFVVASLMLMGASLGLLCIANLAVAQEVPSPEFISAAVNALAARSSGGYA